MATAVYETVDIVLQDGTEIEAKPLPMKYLRQVMKDFQSHWTAVAQGTIPEDEADFAFMDMLVGLAKIALKVYAPQKNYTVAQIEEVIDQPTLYRMLDIAANLGLERMAEDIEKAKSDPNFRQAMMG